MKMRFRFGGQLQRHANKISHTHTSPVAKQREQMNQREEHRKLQSIVLENKKKKFRNKQK